MIRLFLLTLLALPVLAADKPNVLLICVDDLKPILGCYGDTQIKSPNIDALAKRSVLFESAYCNQAVCSPSRNSLMTSFRPQTLGIYDLGTNFRKTRPDAVTMAQAFKNSGYHTESLGKIFHVGHGNVDDEASWSVPSYKATVVGYALKENMASKGLTREEALFSNKPAKDLPKGAAYENSDVPDNAYSDGLLAEEAIKRLQAAAKKPEQPFFLGVGFVKPHLPFVAPKKYWDLYERASFKPADVQSPPEGAPSYAPQFGGELRNYKGIPEQGALPEDLQRTLIHGYYAATSYMDAQLGRVLRTLDETGLSKNTIIVLWGDHGWHLGDHGIWCKHTNYQQAARIPVMVSAPRIAAARSQSFIETVDIYPTLCELASVQAPSGLDGKSFVPVLKDPTQKIREHIIHVYPRNDLLGRAIRTERYRLVEWKKIGESADTAEFELYDYQSDPDETKNLAKDQPEVVAQLRAILGTHPEAKPQFRANAPNGEKAKPKQDRVAMFKSRDKDQDGKLNREEFLANQPDPDEAPKRFPKFDANQDSFLSQEEFVNSGKVK